MRKILSIVLIALLCPRTYGQLFPQHSAGIRVAGGYYGDAHDQGGTRGIVGGEACLFCEDRHALFLEYSHFFPGSDVYDNADLVAAGIRLQGREKKQVLLRCWRRRREQPGALDLRVHGWRYVRCRLSNYRGAPLVFQPILPNLPHESHEHCGELRDWTRFALLMRRAQTLRNCCLARRRRAGKVARGKRVKRAQPLENGA